MFLFKHAKDLLISCVRGYNRTCLPCHSSFWQSVALQCPFLSPPPIRDSVTGWLALWARKPGAKPALITRWMTLREIRLLKYKRQKEATREECDWEKYLRLPEVGGLPVSYRSLREAIVWLWNGWLFCNFVLFLTSFVANLVESELKNLGLRRWLATLWILKGPDEGEVEAGSGHGTTESI